MSTVVVVVVVVVVGLASSSLSVNEASGRCWVGS